MKKIPLLACVSILAVASSAARGQTLYGTNFDGSTTPPYNDPTNYTVNSELSGQGNWAGNDDTTYAESTSPTTNYYGGLNAVVTSTVGGGSVTSSNAGTLYGEILSGTAGGNNYPGAASVYVAHPLTLSTATQTYGYALNTDFAITASTTANTSGYGFAFLNASNQNLVAVHFVQDPNNPMTQDIIEYQVGTGAASAASTTQAISYNGIYHLTLSVNVASNTFSIALGGQAIFSNVSLGTVGAASSATEVAALQFINGTPTTDGMGGYTNSGNDELTFDNFTVALAPEPSTYVMMGLGLVGLFGLMKFRRTA